MARPRINLQAYQQGILERLQHVATDSGAADNARLGIHAGGQQYLVALRDIKEVLPVPEIHAVPLVQPWFLGMCNIRGNLYAVTDLARFLGSRHQPAVMTAESRLMLVHDDFDINAAFLIDSLAGLRSLGDFKPLEMVADGPSYITSRHEDDQHHLWEELNMALILEKQEFLQVAA
ncbi:CheW protein [Methylobacillus flagellatus KT]|uniref:CheW protein n=1 Tax=Methylobacillus flagellatus (strain ATCC 51484 / DSM 6875 / VKM B-1610 / KT) TaxID=265072 RepID=Q1H1X5_METFK|nr:chemotaxis protein CheW [Methylobacillus sp.]ABE49512.1 CheW protein [Methylobacillus flagellatus KT]